jgi:hypothetical protein
MSKKASFLGVGLEDLVEITLSYGTDPKEMILNRLESDWFLGDKKIKDPSKINLILAALRDLRLEDLTPIKDDDELIKYGLDIPLVKLGLRDKNGKNASLYIGDKSPVGDKRYGLTKNNNTAVTLDDIYDILLVKEQDLVKE